MCGIGGIIGESNKKKGSLINKKLFHRGPDGSGIWTSEGNEFPSTICHTRLKIIDLTEEGSQPFFSKDLRYVFTYNGEIYNYLELRKELKKKGCVFRTNTDTEVLLEGLILEGKEFLLKCNGMWAFCLWDRKEKKAFLARDRFGIKPLYYSLIEGNKLIFASEMKAIVQFFNKITPSEILKDWKLNLFNYEASELCVFKDVKRVRPGHYITFKNSRVEAFRYWNTLDHIKFSREKYDDSVMHWRDLFLNSVRIRMRSDVPLGATLSGGLDSSSVVAAMSFIGKENVDFNANKDWQHIFCSSFPGLINDETNWAKMVADDLSIPINLIKVNPSELLSIEKSLAIMEDPVITSPLPMLALYKSVKSNGISVCLDGHGPDEMLSGYGHIGKTFSLASNLKNFAELIAIDESTRTGVFSPKEKKLKRIWIKNKIYEILRKFKNTNSFVKIFSRSNDDIHNLDKSPFMDDIENNELFLEMDPFNQVLFELFHCSILPSLLRNYDKYSMAYGVETRVPFLDWKLVTYAFSLPWHFKVGGGYSKRILRDSMKGILTDEVRLRRDKIGFSADALINNLFRNKLKNNIQNILDNSLESQYAPECFEIWNKFLKSKESNDYKAMQVWTTLLPIFWEYSLKDNLWK